MTDYLRLPIGTEAPHVVNAIVEIPRDSVNKYEYDVALNVFRLDRNLYSPVHYPGDYGFIPSTISEDGDPLDVLVLTGNPSFTGCLIEIRPIGMLEMLDQGVRDKKVLGVGLHNPRHQQIRNYTEVYPHQLREIEHFFSIYKDLEGKRTEMVGWRDVGYALEAIRDSHERFKQQETKKSA
jgi:inorganic pyrophosphatase